MTNPARMECTIFSLRLSFGRQITPATAMRNRPMVIHNHRATTQWGGVATNAAFLHSANGRIIADLLHRLATELNGLFMFMSGVAI